LNYRIVSGSVKCICIPLVYILSYYCFSKTDLFNIINAISGSGIKTFLIITLALALLFILLSMKKGGADGFIFLVCTLFCLAAAAGYSRMNWISTVIYYATHILIAFRTSIPEENVAVICIIVVSGCMLISYASRWEREYDALVSGDICRDEASHAFGRRTAYLLFILSAALTLSAVLYMVQKHFEELLKIAALSISKSPAVIALAGVIPLICFLVIYLSSMSGKSSG